ncbi:MAG: beta-galactosidase [Phycisphaerae bacterium]
MNCGRGFVGICVWLCLGLASGGSANGEAKKGPKYDFSSVHPRRSLPGQFVQKDFEIGLWVDPPIDDKADSRYKDLADANFTVVIGQHAAATVEKRATQLQLCEKYGLKAIVSCGDPPPPPYTRPPMLLQKDSPACLGYFIMDEPNPNKAMYSFLKKHVEMIRLQQPGKLALINLLPNVPVKDMDDSRTVGYDEYIARIINEINPDVLSMDHYPTFRPDMDTRDDYIVNLDYMRKYSQAAGIPFWNFFNTMPFWRHTDPTESQIRWQVYASIAYGAKGLFYFCYYTVPPFGEGAKGSAIIDRLDRKTRHYDQAKRINFEVKNLGPTLMKLTSTGVYRVRPGDDAGKILAGAPIKTIKLSEPKDPPHDYLIGVFRHFDKRKAVLIQNYRYAFTAWPTVEFSVPADRVWEVDKQTGKERPAVDDSPDLPGFQVSLDAGEGRLFLIP